MKSIKWNQMEEFCFQPLTAELIKHELVCCSKSILLSNRNLKGLKKKKEEEEEEEEVEKKK